MYFQTRILDSTAAVFLLMALFILGLQVTQPPSCRCPRGFTYAQCNYTNMVCLTQAFFVNQEAIVPNSERPGAEPLDDVTAHHDVVQADVKALKREISNNDGSISEMSKSKSQEFKHSSITKQHKLHVEVVTSGKGLYSNSVNEYDILRSKLILYNAYAVILIAVAILLSVPKLVWVCTSVEKDILCMMNTFTYAGADSTTVSRQRCVDQLVGDMKFFLRSCHGSFYKNILLMHVLRPLIPFLIPVTLTFIPGVSAKEAFTLNPMTLMSALHNQSMTVFPSNAFCQFQVISRSTPKWVSTTCLLPASELLQILTPVLIVWLVLLSIFGLYKYYSFMKVMSFANQKSFYGRHGLKMDKEDATSLQNVFGNDGFLLFTLVSEVDKGNILPHIMYELKACMDSRIDR
ncbi:uncharacterized protein LOC124272441 isoform X2 [Haliotis rubra]|uniref:uncharacterized protein LOC124272441 isoform X2 n=1 Tax=Haliotis rubra TaxID=36100 RepID=UPI001EE5A9BE|nr:uncharacterized protein LOC124272441 isoform X2 [Haliotis rubra]